MPMSLVQSAGFMVAVVVAAAGCGTGGTSTGHDAGTDAGSTGGSDAGPDGGNGCGVCVTGPASGWGYPGLLWIGAEKDAPPCPVEASAEAYSGHADLDAPIGCGTCTCASPAGSCALPAMMTASAAPCGQGGTATPFDPSPGWAGACDSNEAIPSGKLCSGVPCVQSLTIGQLAVKEGGCAPSQPQPQSPPTWKTYGRECQRFPYRPCPANSGDVCVPVPPPGFRVCIFHGGDVPCPTPADIPYQERHVFYDTFQDTRACSACACGTPAGSTCSSKLSIYTDGACSTLAYSATVDATGPACHALPAGSPLGSKSATPPTYTPGACPPSGGMPLGAAIAVGPSTYCCLPP